MAWPIKDGGRTMIVSADGGVRLCLLCLVGADETGFVGNWIQMWDFGPDPLEVVAEYFKEEDGFVERALPSVFTNGVTLGYNLWTMELRWINHEGRECVARFRTTDEALVCAEGLRQRGVVLEVQLMNDDGEPYKEA